MKLDAIEHEMVTLKQPKTTISRISQYPGMHLCQKPGKQSDAGHEREVPILLEGLVTELHPN